jgi:predicted neuraminidase/peroxiredoxin
MKNCVLGLLTSIVLTCASTSAAIEPGEVVGPLGLTALSGESIVMSNYHERPATVVLFLSSRCEATNRLMADINQLHQRHRLEDVLFVGISSNPAESGDELRQFAQRLGAIFPIYRDPNGALAKTFSAQVTPEVFLLDPRGALVYHGGLQDPQARSSFESAVDRLFRKQSPEVKVQASEGTPIDRPGPKRDWEDPYGSIAFSSELVFEKITFAAAHHCSTICEAANRDLLCLWYGGSYESADDQALFLARRAPEAKQWGTPQVLLRGATQPPGNGVIFRDASDRLEIVWCRMEGTRPMRRGSGWDRCRLMSRTSSDQGHTWSDDRPLFDDTVWCVPRNPPITTSDGTLVLPVEGLQGTVEGSYFLTLEPNATRWRLAGFTSGGSQPAVVQRSDGSLFALLRHARYIMQIESRDRGQNWSEAVQSPHKNPDAGITMTKLANGHLVLVYNDSQVARTPLNIVRSIDEGKTWQTPLHLESNPGEYSYPCIIQAADGKIHVSYTYRRYAVKHVELNEDWLYHSRRPN